MSAPQSDMMILAEIHQISDALPKLEQDAKEAAAKAKTAKSALKAARVRLRELCRPEGGT